MIPEPLPVAPPLELVQVAERRPNAAPLQPGMVAVTDRFEPETVAVGVLGAPGAAR